MKKKLSIPTPCHEDWSKMQGDDKKRYCDSCSHHVEDFTDKSVEEIISILEKREGRTCGRLKRSQLNPIKKIAATVMLGSSLLLGCSSEPTYEIQSFITEQGITKIPIKISGVLSLSDGDVRGTSVKISKLATISEDHLEYLVDSNGEFIYENEIDITELEDYFLVIYHSGFEMIHLPLSEVNGLSNLEIELKEIDFSMMTLGWVVPVEKSWFEKLIDKD